MAGFSGNDKRTKVDFGVYFDPSNPARVLLAANDDRFTDADGARPGLRAAWAANPLSADYSPGNYNRVVRAFRDDPQLVLPDGAAEVAERPRNIDQRVGVIVETFREALRTATAGGHGGDDSGTDVVLPAPSSRVNPHLRRLATVMPSLRRARAVLAGLVGSQGGIAVVLAQVDGTLLAWDGWYSEDMFAPVASLVPALDGDDPFHDVRALSAAQWQHTPAAVALAEGVPAAEYATWLHTDDVETAAAIATAEPFTFVAL